MPRKSKSLNKGSDAELRAYLFHDSGQKLFGGTSGEQDLGDSSDVHQNQEFSIDSEEFPSLPGSEASPGIGNRNAVQDLAVPQNLGNATSGSNQATNSGPGNLSVQGQNQPSSSVLQQGPSSGEPISQSHVRIVNSPNSKRWFSDKSSNTKFPGDLSDYFPSADPPNAFLRLQEQQDSLQRESCSSHQQGQQQVPAVSTGGTSSSVNSQDILQNTNGAGGSIPRVLSASSGSGSSAGAPISQSQFQAQHRPSSMGMLNDQQNQQDETLPGFTDNHTNSRAKEKLQEDTMPTLPRQHIPPMSRTVGFGLGESSSPFRQQINAVSPSLLQRRLASYAEAELYNRGWIYHKGLNSWLLKDSNVPLSEQTQTHEKGSYTCFDAVSMTSIRMEDFVVEYKMLKERPALPRH